MVNIRTESKQTKAAARPSGQVAILLKKKQWAL